MDKYYNIDEILNLDISDTLLSEIKDNLNKRVFWGQNGVCKIGKLCGLSVEDNEIYYILKVNNDEVFIPIWKSLTRV